MVPDLLPLAQKFLAGKAWNSETVLRMGVELLSVADSPSLSFHHKTSLVCQTILRMLDGVEKVGKEHSLESIEIMPTTAQLEECKNLVKTLPLILELVSTGLHPQSFDRKPVACVPQGCLPFVSWRFVRKEVAETVTAVEDVLKHPQAYLEEMRGLVSKVEMLLSKPVAAPVPEPVAVPVAVPEHVVETLPEPVHVVETQPEPVSVPETTAEQSCEIVQNAFAAAAEPLLQPRLPPSPVSSDEQLPGGLATPEEVELSQ